MSLYEILDYLEIILFGFIFFPIIAAIYRWKSLSDTDKLVFYFLCSLLLMELVSIILGYSHIRNHFMHYVHTAVSLIFSYLFFSGMSENANLKKSLLFLLVVILILIPVEVIFIAGFNQLNSISESLSYVYIIFFSGVSLRKILHQNIFDSISKNHFFWFSLAFLILGLFSVIPSYFNRQFIESSLELYYFFDTLSMIGNVIAYLVFAFGLVQKKEV